MSPNEVVNRLVEAYHVGLVMFAQRHVGRDVAQDVVHEVWIGLLTRLRNGSVLIAPTGVMSYLYRIVYNKCVDHLRRTGRSPVVLTDGGDGPEAPDAGLDVPDLAGLAERAEDVRQAVGRLSPLERAVIYLRYFVGLTQQETADVLGLSGPPAVHRIEQRALAELRVLLDPHSRVG